MARSYDVLGGATMDFLNTTRGQALEAVFRALKAREDTEARWRLVESMAYQPGAALRVGALQELLSLANIHELDRSWRAFTALCENTKDVLRCAFAHHFLAWIVHHRPEEAMPCVRDLMDEEHDSLAEQGAQIACIFALRSGDINSVLLDELLSGRAPWRQAVAEVASDSVTRVLPFDILAECQRLLKLCFEEEDPEVRRHAAHFTTNLREEHTETLAELLEAFVRSRAYKEGDHWLHEFLLQSGDLRPEWTLDQVQVILDRSIDGEAIGGLGGDELARCVLRLYTLPEMAFDVSFRSRCMNIFGELLDRAHMDAQQALKEWDEGRFF